LIAEENRNNTWLAEENYLPKL